MYRFTLLLLTLLSFTIVSKAQEAYGLEFACKNMAQESRTSLDLFPAQPFLVKDKYSLSFDLSFMPFYNSYFGYVFRMIDEKHQNIDLIYNVHTYSFDIVTGNEFSGISFKINNDSLYHQWNNIRLDVNTVTHTLCVSVNGRQIRSIHHPVLSGQQINVCFGANHRKTHKTFDIAPMRIKDVKLYSDNELQHHWPLDQVKGNSDKDVVAGQTASVKNPIWLRPKFSQWQLADSFMINGNAAVAMDPGSETVYITGRDYVYNYNCSQHTLLAKALPQLQGTPAGIQAVYDNSQKQLYNIFPDKQQYTVYDSTRGKWEQSIDHDAITTFWHANMLYAPFDSSIYLLGGYGDFRYKNEVHRYQPQHQTWENIPVTGDFFTPRYLSAAGANKAGDSIYVLGGYGSLAGDQLLNPHSLYDLLVFDVKRKQFKSIYQLKEPEEPFAFAHQLIINSERQEYYALMFPNDRMNASLQLIKGSLKTPAYSKIATSIPYSFYDTKSAAYLFYCPDNDKLIAVTLFSPKNNVTQAKIYTLQFSPYGLEVKLRENNGISAYVTRLMIMIAVAFSLFAMAAGISWLTGGSLLKKKKAEEVIPAILPVTATTEPATTMQHVEKVITAAPAPVIPRHAAAIYLFGHFTVLDKEGNDISRLFSPLLKELFLLLFLHSLMGKHGISSEKVNELLWPGRSVKDAKNNRSVNIVKLKNILDKTGAYTLLKENDKWIFHFDEEDMLVDLQQYLQLLEQISPTDVNGINRMADIVKRGAFLQETEYSWLDKFKADISNKAIPLLIHFLESHAASPELTIHVCDCILNFDSLCEEAVMFKCKALVVLRQHASAKKIYTSFSAEYERIYGEPFEMEYTKAIC